jgi:hypothetical protein
MSLRLLVVGLLAGAGLAVATLVAAPADAHQSGCHSAHTCPSDHHTYVWYDPSTGRGWDCAEPGAPEFDPSLDRTVISWQGYTYYCRAAGSSSPPPTTTTTTPPTGGACHVHGKLPDHRCTPGVSFARVTAKQVCVRGYSSRVRNVPESVKRAVYARYGIATHTRGQYEVDHLISLELGGSNSIRNLWPEAADPRPGFHEKDRVENYLHAHVCDGLMTLARAQHLIATNWLAVYGTLPR